MYLLHVVGRRMSSAQEGCQLIGIFGPRSTSTSSGSSNTTVAATSTSSSSTSSRDTTGAVVTAGAANILCIQSNLHQGTE